MQITDLHTHTTFSDGDGRVEQVMAAAERKGYRLGISDHVFCSEMTDFDTIDIYFDTLRHYPVLVGVEANIGDFTQWPARMEAKLDYVIASVHSLMYRGNPLILSQYFGARAGLAIIACRMRKLTVSCCWRRR